MTAEVGGKYILKRMGFTEEYVNTIYDMLSRDGELNEDDKMNFALGVADSERDSLMWWFNGLQFETFRGYRSSGDEGSHGTGKETLSATSDDHDPLLVEEDMFKSIGKVVHLQDIFTYDYVSLPMVTEYSSVWLEKVLRRVRRAEENMSLLEHHLGNVTKYGYLEFFVHINELVLNSTGMVYNGNAFHTVSYGSIPLNGNGTCQWIVGRIITGTNDLLRNLRIDDQGPSFEEWFLGCRDIIDNCLKSIDELLKDHIHVDIAAFFSFDTEEDKERIAKVFVDGVTKYCKDFEVDSIYSVRSMSMVYKIIRSVELTWFSYNNVVNQFDKIRRILHLKKYESDSVSYLSYMEIVLRRLRRAFVYEIPVSEHLDMSAELGRFLDDRKIRMTETAKRLQK